jgi:phage shock protein C
MANSFYRDKSQGVIAGVCAGLAAYFGVSVVLLRLVFLLLAFSGGPAVAAYLILWLILPEKGVVGGPHEDTLRRNAQEIGAQARGLGQEIRSALGGQGATRTTPSKRVLWLGAILIVIGLVSLADALHLLSWLRPDYLWAVALILAGVAMLSRAIKSK